MRWRDQLIHPPRYRRQIELLHDRYSSRHRLERLTQEGVRFSEMLLDRRKLSQLLARSVAEGSYHPGPARLGHVWVKDRYRELFRFAALDFVVHGVFGEVIGEAIEPLLSKSLYSYRRRYSSWTAVRRFGKLLRRHAASRPDPRTRGLYVLRADVRKYADTIPVDEPSLLWPELRAALALDAGDPLWRLTRELVRPEMVDAEDAPFMHFRGLALGSPIGTALMNFYLHALDHQLDRLGGYYVRFGDDLLFAHDDPDVTRRAIEMLDRELAARRLALNPKKRRLLFLNGAGRASTEWPEARGARSVAFLGCSASFDGTVSLPDAKVRELFNEIEQRVKRTRVLLGGVAFDERARALCAVVNEALDPRSPFAHKYATLLRRLATSREQLRAFDYQVALLVAGSLQGISGVRAFRGVSWRRLRDEFGLSSVVELRNRD